MKVGATKTVTAARQSDMVTIYIYSAVSWRFHGVKFCVLALPSASYRFRVEVLKVSMLASQLSASLSGPKTPKS